MLSPLFTSLSNVPCDRVHMCDTCVTVGGRFLVYKYCYVANLMACVLTV
jgi:hypothetical protein